MDETAQRAKRALAALRAANPKGVGRVAGGMGAVATDRLADLDSCTLAYRSWTPYLIPGVLQTGTYAGCAIKGRTPSLPAEEVNLRVIHRRARVEGFLRRRLETNIRGMAWFVVGEQAIVRPLMNDSAHVHQLRYLLDLMDEYPIVVQVLPETGLMPGAMEPFELHYLDPGPPVGHIETMIGSLYTVGTEDIARLHGTFSEMLLYALPPGESREYISEVAASCSALSPLVPTTDTRSSSPPTPTPEVASTSPDLPSGA